MGRGFWFYLREIATIFSDVAVCQRNGGQCSSSKCVYLPAGGREREREEFKTCLLHVTESTTFYSIFFSFFFFSNFY